MAPGRARDGGDDDGDDDAFDALRRAGNEAYDREAYVEATRAYTRALATIEAHALATIGDADARTMRRACALRANRAACYVKRRKSARAMEDATWVIARPLDAGPAILVKALYRRARANELIGDVEAAIADLRAAEKIDPHDALIQNGLKQFTSVFHLAVVLDRASPEVLARQPAFRNFKPETRR